MAISGRPRCDHYARPLIELLRTFCLWIDRTYLIVRKAENGEECVETFVRKVAGSGSFLWFGQPGSNVVYAEGASAATLLRKKGGNA